MRHWAASSDPSKPDEHPLKGKTIMHSRTKCLAWTATSLLTLAALACAPTSARANFSFNLTAANESSLGAGPFATVDVTIFDNTHATITFTALGSYAFVNGGSLGLNVAS